MGLLSRIIAHADDEEFGARYSEVHKGTIHGNHGAKELNRLGGKAMNRDKKPDGFLGRGRRHP